jgi:hypothetical protein
VARRAEQRLPGICQWHWLAAGQHFKASSGSDAGPGSNSMTQVIPRLSPTQSLSDSDTGGNLTPGRGS